MSTAATRNWTGQRCNAVVLGPVALFVKLGAFMPSFISLALLGTVIIPPSMYIILKTSSMSAGVLAVALLHSLVALNVRPARRQNRPVLICLVTLALISAIALLSLVAHSRFDMERFTVSFLLLVAVAIGAYSLARSAVEVRADSADKAVKMVFYVLLITGFASAIGFPIFEVEVGKPVSFFIEPSHFALSFLPFLLYMVVRASARMKMVFLSAGLTVALGVSNLTLLAGIALIAMLTLRKRYMVFLAAGGAAAIFLAPGILTEYEEFLSYYVARLDFATDNPNLSVLVFLQGWERAYLNLVETNGFGVGFQQFGIVGSTGDIQGAIMATFGDVSNMLDGGTVGSKLVGEFGVIGVLLLISYAAALARQAAWFRSASENGTTDNSDLFFRCCFAMYATDLFVRGSGYFSPSGFLMFAALFWFSLNRDFSSTGDRHTLVHRP